jgi:hypothetical protein
MIPSVFRECFGKFRKVAVFGTTQAERAATLVLVRTWAKLASTQNLADPSKNIVNDAFRKIAVNCEFGASWQSGTRVHFWSDPGKTAADFRFAPNLIVLPRW